MGIEHIKSGFRAAIANLEEVLRFDRKSKNSTIETGFGVRIKGCEVKHV